MGELFALIFRFYEGDVQAGNRYFFEGVVELNVAAVCYE